MVDKKDLDRAVADKLTEIFAAAGLRSSRAALELLYLMPRDFVSAYEELFEKALKLDGSSATGALKSAAELGKAKGGTSQTVGKKTQLSGGAGKKFKTFWVVKDDDALALKHLLDKKLRRLGREIREDLREGVERTKVRCGRCKQLMSRDWNFCAGCGEHKPLTIRETKLPLGRDRDKGQGED